MDTDLLHALPLSRFPNATPFPWMGGKSRLADTIIDLLPEHETYVEPFGGAANVLLKKPAYSSKVEVYNDMSGLLVNFFRVLQDTDQRKTLMDRLEWTPYARMEYARATRLLANPDDLDPVMRAWAFFTAQCQGISGAGSMGKKGAGNWGYSRATNQSGNFRTHVQKLPSIAQRLMQVHIEHEEGLDCIHRWDSQDTLFYLDPPYVNATRSSKSRTGKGAVYHAEIEDDGHVALVNALLAIKGMAILSGYASPLYAPLEAAGWERREYVHDLSAAAHVRGYDFEAARSQGKRQRVECLWLSPRVLRSLRRVRQQELLIF